MVKSKHLLIVLPVLFTGSYLFAQTNIENKDTSQNKINIIDTLTNHNLNNDFQYRHCFDLSKLNISQDSPLGFKKLALKFSLIDNFETWNNGFKIDKYYNESVSGTYITFWKQQKAGLLTALRGFYKPESKELTSIRKYLGLSKDVAAFVLLIIHLLKY